MDNNPFRASNTSQHHHQQQQQYPSQPYRDNNGSFNGMNQQPSHSWTNPALASFDPIQNTTTTTSLYQQQPQQPQPQSPPYYQTNGMNQYNNQPLQNNPPLFQQQQPQQQQPQQQPFPSATPNYLGQQQQLQPNLASMQSGYNNIPGGGGGSNLMGNYGGGYMAQAQYSPYAQQPQQPQQQYQPPPQPQYRHAPVDAASLLKSREVRRVDCPVCHKTIEGDDPAINHHVNEHYS